MPVSTPIASAASTSAISNLSSSPPPARAALPPLVDAVDADGCSALMDACLRGDLPAVHWLLEHGASVNLCSSGCTALDFALVFRPGDVALLGALTASGAKASGSAEDRERLRKRQAEREHERRIKIAGLSPLSMSKDSSGVLAPPLPPLESSSLTTDGARTLSMLLQAEEGDDRPDAGLFSPVKRRTTYDRYGDAEDEEPTSRARPMSAIVRDHFSSPITSFGAPSSPAFALQSAVSSRSQPSTPPRRTPQPIRTPGSGSAVANGGTRADFSPQPSSSPIRSNSSTRQPIIMSANPWKAFGGMGRQASGSLGSAGGGGGNNSNASGGSSSQNHGPGSLPRSGSGMNAGSLPRSGSGTLQNAVGSLPRSNSNLKSQGEASDPWSGASALNDSNPPGKDSRSRSSSLSQQLKAASSSSSSSSSTIPPPLPLASFRGALSDPRETAFTEAVSETPSRMRSGSGTATGAGGGGRMMQYQQNGAAKQLKQQELSSFVHHRSPPPPSEYADPLSPLSPTSLAAALQAHRETIGSESAQSVATPGVRPPPTPSDVAYTPQQLSSAAGTPNPQQGARYSSSEGRHSTSATGTAAPSSGSPDPSSSTPTLRLLLSLILDASSSTRGVDLGGRNAFLMGLGYVGGSGSGGGGGGGSQAEVMAVVAREMMKEMECAFEAESAGNQATPPITPTSLRTRTVSDNDVVSAAPKGDIVSPTAIHPRTVTPTLPSHHLSPASSPSPTVSPSPSSLNPSVSPAPMGNSSSAGAGGASSEVTIWIAGKLRILSVLKSWIRGYAEDFTHPSAGADAASTRLANSLAHQLSNFPPASWSAHPLLAPHLPGLAKLAGSTAKSLLELDAQAATALPPIMRTPVHPASEKVRIASLAHSGLRTLIDLPILTLASTIHAWTIQRFADIGGPRKLLRHGKLSRTVDALGVDGRNQMRLSNQVSLWAASAFLSAGASPGDVLLSSTGFDLMEPSVIALRVRALRKLIGVCVALVRVHGDFNACFELLIGLGMQPAHRLIVKLERESGGMLPEAERQVLKRLQEMMHSSENYMAYRTLYSSTPASPSPLLPALTFPGLVIPPEFSSELPEPRVPYLGVLLKDVTALEEGGEGLIIAPSKSAPEQAGSPATQPDAVQMKAAEGEVKVPADDAAAARGLDEQERILCTRIHFTKLRSIALLLFDAFRCLSSSSSEIIAAAATAKVEHLSLFRTALDLALSEQELSILSERIAPPARPTANRTSSVGPTAVSPPAAIKQRHASMISVASLPPPSDALLKATLGSVRSLSTTPLSVSTQSSASSFATESSVASSLSVTSFGSLGSSVGSPVGGTPSRYSSSAGVRARE
jgi:hypothetical protein